MYETQSNLVPNNQVFRYLKIILKVSSSYYKRIYMSINKFKNETDMKDNKLGYVSIIKRYY